MESVLYDAAGHRRSPATMPGFHQGRSPRNKGLRYPADPPTIEEIIAVMRAAGQSTGGARLRALIVILWRAGLGVNGHRFLPTSGHEIPHWWPSFLPAGGHQMSPLVAIESPHRGGLRARSGQGHHPFAGGGLGEPVAVLAVGDQDVCVMK